MQPSFGSGSNLLGAPASTILGMPGGLQQQSPASAGFHPGVLPPTNQPSQIGSTNPPSNQLPGFAGGPPGPDISIVRPPVGNQPSPVAGFNQAPMQQPGVVGLPPSNPEAMMIIKALASRINHINDGEKLQRGQ